MSEPIYTQDWISPYFPLWNRLLPSYFPDEHVPQILEIGCFEGRATCWFLQRYPTALVWVVDTFEGGKDHKELGLDFSTVQSRFDYNIAPWQDRVRLYVDESWKVLRRWTGRGPVQLDIALIDGSHVACDVLSDAVLTWPLVSKGGIVIFDDMGWGGPDRPRHETPAPAIEAFLACYKGQYELLEHGYQVIVRKK